MKKLPILILICLSHTLYAQTTDSTIEEQTFTITESYKFEPINVVKNPFHAPITKETSQRENSVNFVLEPQSLYYPYLSLATNPLAYQNNDDRDTFRHYIKAGYGNYKRPLLKTGFTINTRQKSPIDLNLLYDHSEGDRAYQIQETITGDVSMRVPVRTVDDIDLRAMISSQKRNLYGFPQLALPVLPKAEYIENRWLLTDFEAKFRNGKKRDALILHLEPSIRFRGIENSFDQTEQHLEIHSHIQYAKSRRFKIDIDPFVSYQTLAGAGSIDNTVVGVKTAAQYKHDRFTSRGIVEFNNVVGTFFAEMGIRLPLVTQKSYLHIDLGRDYTQNTLRDFYTQNNFIKNLDTIQNTTRSFFEAGVHGSTGSIVDMGFTFSYSAYDQFVYFMQTDDEVADNYFDIKYTDDLHVLSLGGEIKLRIKERYDLYTQIKVNNYNQNLENDQIAYIPRIEAKAKLDLPLWRKLDAYVALLYYSSREDLVSGAAIRLDDYIDLGLGLRYSLNTHWKLWLDASNLLNQELDYYYNYPSLGTNFRTGILYLF